MVFYYMSPAGILRGIPETIDTSATWELKAFADKKLDDFERKHGFKMTMRFTHVPDSFARMLVKIGYGNILTTLHPSDFRPLCVPYILGVKKNLSFIVGGDEELSPRVDFGYHLGTLIMGRTDHIALVAKVRLFAHLNTPTYHIVVGDVIGQTNVQAVIRKFGEGTFDWNGSSNQIDYLLRCLNAA
jgi:hypothetical protein